MKKTLIVFESKEDILVYLKKRDIASLSLEGTSIFAIEPTAQAYLKRRGIKYFNSTILYDAKSHSNLIEKTLEVIEPLKKIVDIKDNLSVEKGYNNSFIVYLRHFSLLYILFLIELIELAICISKADKLIFITYERDFSITSNFQGEDKLCGILAKRIAIKRAIDFDMLIADTKRISKFKTSLKMFGKATLEYLLYYSNLTVLKFLSKKNKLVLFSSESYGLSQIARVFAEKYNSSYCVYLYSNRNKLTEIKAVILKRRYWNMFSALPSKFFFKSKCFNFEEFKIISDNIKSYFKKNKKLLKYRDIDFSDLLIEKMEKAVFPQIKELIVKTFFLDNFLKTVRPSLIVTQMARGLLYNLGELSRKYNIPSVIISHGSHVVFENRLSILEARELASGLMNTSYEYVALQSPLAYDYFKSEKIHSKAINTGPLILSDLNNENKNKVSLREKIIPKIGEKIIFLHAGTAKINQSLRPLIYETIDEYIFNINTLIKSLEEFDDVHLIVRFRPNLKHHLKDFRSLLIKSDKYSIHCEGSFTDYLSVSDLLISYSSTTIEEALLNNIPVLLYDHHDKFCYIKEATRFGGNVEPVLNSCYYATSEVQLKKAFNFIITNNIEKKVPLNLWEKYRFSSEKISDITSCFSNIF